MGLRDSIINKNSSYDTHNMNEFESKIKTYFENCKVQIIPKPSLTIGDKIKNPDFKVYIDNRWVFLEVTKTELSMRGKNAFLNHRATFDNMDRFANQVDKEYHQHFKGYLGSEPIVIIVNTEGSELSDFYYSQEKFAIIPPISAVVNYNSVHLNFSNNIGDIVVNNKATNALTKKEISILSFPRVHSET